MNTTGKSDIVKHVAKVGNLKLIDFRLSQADPTDLCGFPTIDKETKRSYYAAPKTFPLDTDKIPDGYDGWLLFFDEMNAAPLSVQAATYKVMLDRQIGEQSLHPNVAIVCAGNLATDRAIVNRLSTAMQSRLIHFQLMVDYKAWVDWAFANSIDFRIIAYIQFRPDILHKFDPKHDDVTFPCPRTWEFLSKLIANKKDIIDSNLALFAGTIGEATAYEFLEFSKIYTSLPKLADIIANPTGIDLPHEPSIMYAVSSMIGKHATDTNIGKLMAFVERLPIEFQVITLQSVVKTKKALIKNPAIKQWISINAKELV